MVADAQHAMIIPELRWFNGAWFGGCGSIDGRKAEGWMWVAWV
jgi:hypothetical protein